MDRLVCGDVGFGKTEVAVRAAFAVALNGKQTLMLVPTTVLAQQHWNTFRERYRDFPVRVEMVSRFRKPADAKTVLADFADGKVDVLIGTHRVLSRDVIPKNLGLVDRRRGAALRRRAEGAAARAAARGRRARADRDADPAHAAHVALRPPRHLRDRDAARGPAADPHARRRVRRGAHQGSRSSARQAAAGSRSTCTTASRRSTRPPHGCGALPGAAHPRRPRPDEGARAGGPDASQFLRGDADVLVSTTIIESGLDIPQANTLIVERADMLGLAQLYQIRGRVGRSDVTAYAYLFYPGRLGADARRRRARLATLADHTELGAGFAIAMRDLEIRGAGDLLGAEQSGHVAARRLRALRRAAQRGGRRALRPAAHCGAAGARRRPRRRVRAGRRTSARRR